MNERKDYEGHKTTWIILSIIFILLCVFGFPNGCFKAEAADSPRLSNGKSTKHDFGTMYTSLHDGHWWVVANRHSAGLAMVHHPDCACGKGGK